MNYEHTIRAYGHILLRASGDSVQQLIRVKYATE